MSPSVRKRIKSKGKQKVKMNTLRSKVKWFLVSRQTNFSGSACNLWLRWSRGIGVAIKPALSKGRMGSKKASHKGSLGIKPISKVGQVILRLVPWPGMIRSSWSTGKGLKFGLGALVNKWMDNATIINMGRANKNVSSVHMISHTRGNFTWKKPFNWIN